MGFLTKTYGFVLQVILVVAAVLLFSYLDPFGILSPSKLKLKDTPITVESIRDIGQLITAEYYGEVIKSYKGSLNERTDEELANVKEQYQDIHSEFSEAITLFEQTKMSSKRRKRVYEDFADKNPSLVSNYLFRQYINYLKHIVDGEEKNYNKKELDEDIGERALRGFIKDLWLCLAKNKTKRKGKWNKQSLDKLFSNELPMTTYSTTFKDEKYKLNEKKIGNKRLVLLGRGWVKAGYDFKNFTNQNFKYDAKKGRIDIIGLQPKILSQAISTLR